MLMTALFTNLMKMFLIPLYCYKKEPFKWPSDNQMKGNTEKFNSLITSKKKCNFKKMIL